MKAIVNLSKVVFASLTKFINLTTFGIGIFMSILIPQLTLVLMLLTFIFLSIQIGIDLTNEEFIQSVLLNKNTSDNKFLQKEIRSLESYSKNITLDEITKDIRVIIKLAKTLRNQIITNPLADFSKKYIEEIIQQFIEISKQEELARTYLKSVDKEQLKKETEFLNKDINNSTDKITRLELEKSLTLQKDRLLGIEQIEQKVKRLDSYIMRIISTLEHASTQIAQMQLANDNSKNISGTILTESLAQIVSDINDYESRSIDIATQIEKNTDKTTVLVNS
jgi:hypothetical protein